MFRERMRLIPESVDGLTTLVQEKLAWLDGLMVTTTTSGMGAHGGFNLILRNGFWHRRWTINRPISSLTAWFSRIDSRPSAEASKHQTTAEVGMRGI